MIFGEAMTSLDEYQRFTQAIKAPVLANLTEFGRTPLFSLEEMRSVGVSMVLYPLSAFRAMSAAAQAVYESLRAGRPQSELLARMQSRDELYDVLGYHAYERKLDALFKASPETDKP